MSDIQEVQDTSLNILKEVVSICNRHDLTYYLSCGTLLGAIRHNGFIPWDDDIDIEMPVEDYKQFLKYAKKELRPGFFLQTYYTDPGYNELWAKVRIDGTTSLPVICKNLKIHFGVGIDIFPLSGIPSNSVKKNLQNRFFTLCRTLLSKDYTIVTGCDDISSNKKLQLIYAVPRWLRIMITRILEHFVLQSPRSTEKIALVADNMDFSIDKKFYSNKEPHTFEDSQFYIPSSYHAILTAMYGDYMTPPPDAERKHHELILGKIIYDCHKDYHEYQD